MNGRWSALRSTLVRTRTLGPAATGTPPDRAPPGSLRIFTTRTHPNSCPDVMPTRHPRSTRSPHDPRARGTSPEDFRWRTTEDTGRSNPASHPLGSWTRGTWRPRERKRNSPRLSSRSPARRCGMRVLALSRRARTSCSERGRNRSILRATESSVIEQASYVWLREFGWRQPAATNQSLIWPREGANPGRTLIESTYPGGGKCDECGSATRTSQRPVLSDL